MMYTHKYDAKIKLAHEKERKLIEKERETKLKALRKIGSRRIKDTNVGKSLNKYLVGKRMTVRISGG